MRSKIIIILIAVLVFGIFLIFIYPDIPMRIGTGGIRLFRDSGELSLFYFRSEWIQRAGVPYRDVFVEYPPLAAYYLAWPRVFTQNFLSYERLFIAGNIIVFLIFVLTTNRLLKIFRFSQKRLIFLFLPAAAYFSLYRFDLLPAFFVQLSILFIVKKKYFPALLMLIVSGLIKWYAFLLAPVFIYWFVRENGWEKTKKTLLAACGLLFLVFVLSALYFGPNMLNPYVAQFGRPIEPGSIYYLFFSEITGRFFVYLLPALMFILQIIPFFLWLAIGFILKKTLVSLNRVIIWSALIIMTFFLFAKFYSPQWHLWFLPLMLLLPLNKKEIILLVTHDLVSFLSFPLLYDTVGDGSGLYYAASGLGSLILVLLIYGLLKKLWPELKFKICYNKKAPSEKTL